MVGADSRGGADWPPKPRGGLEVPHLSVDDIEWLRRAEHSLWDDHDRFDTALMDSLWAAEFHEVGRSGRRWSRQELLDVDPGPIGASLHDMEVLAVTEDAVLVRYLSVQWPDGEGSGDGRAAHRTSLWRRSDGPTRWQLVFHQGTPTTR